MISIFRGAGRRNELAYSTERRAAVLKKLEPPNAVPLRQLAKDEGISEATLHTWRRDARSQGRLLPDADAGPDGWTSRDKFAAVIETAALNEVDLAAYCRQRGLYAEQIQTWRTACEQANDWARASSQRLGQATKDDKKQIKALERDLARKEKALAEAAALLVLRKNAAAIWGTARTHDQHPRSPERHRADRPGQGSRRTPRSGLRGARDRRAHLPALASQGRHARGSPPDGCSAGTQQRAVGGGAPSRAGCLQQPGLREPAAQPDRAPP